MPTLNDDWEPMNPRTCPVCGSTYVTVLDDRNDVGVYRCDNCEHRWEEETP